MLEIFWILLIFPLIGFVLSGLLGKRLAPGTVAAICCISVLLSFLVAAVSFVELLNLPAQERIITNSLFTWIQAGDFRSNVSFLLDPLSAVLILIVTGVGFLIHVYSIEYMRGEEGFYRYFSYLNLFIFMMSILVLADNYLLMFVGWEGVGLCSFLLIGYYFETKTAADAAKKAFIVNRIGDMGFILGILLLFKTFGSIEYLTVFERVVDRFPEPAAGLGVLGVITLLFFVGATGKSAQIPLYVWLPDAMAGPTPVSALIHAATMVTAGVYMIARSSALYSRAPETMAVVAIVGILTALLAALIATTQRDIKKVLAYSTVSQLGYMFLAVGVGAFGAGIFHLYTHAFFKALLFLGSGSVILALHHEQDMMNMGGLKKYLPITWATMGVATLAIAGIPPLSGFFSKDEILWKSLTNDHGHTLLWATGVVVAALTAFYMARLMFLTFHGQERFESSDAAHSDHHTGGHHAPSEPSAWITVPLVILAFFSAVAGWIGLPAWLGTNHFEHFLEPSFSAAYHADAHAAHHDYTLEIVLTVLVVGLALFSIWLAYRAFIRKPKWSTRLAARYSGVYTLLRNKFYVDEIYDSLLVRPIERGSRGILWRVMDVSLIDGLVNGTGHLMQRWSHVVKKLQSGYARVYASWIFLGAVLIFVFYYLSVQVA